MAHGDLTLIFTRHGETADSYIERAAAQTPRYRELRVATSDGLEQSQVLSSGAIRMTSRELLRELRDVPAGQRSARFHAVIVLLRDPADPRPLIAEGSWEGLITDVPRGSNGFGYNPVFLDPAHGLTAAEMEPGLKNRISHRAQALAKLRELLRA